MILEKISSPRDVQVLSDHELRLLAEEIRQKLIQVTAANGGHLAPNLGTVELTLALHRVFDFPYDHVVWDVGHQSYTHKLLTGRLADFSTIRTYGGLSGFPKITESEYDCFGTGHSSTSISAATGLALARDLKKEKREVLAVIGDGALTGGMAYEALNHAGHLGLKMTVILNDNEMSIDPNVGAISDYLTRMRSAPGYNKSKEELEYLLKRIPAIGGRIAEVFDHLKDTFKYMLVPGKFFEELGFHYFGPINGHDIDALTTVLANSKTLNKPVLIHVITTKGRGYGPAENYPDKFHGTGAFAIATGEVLQKSTSPTYTQVFAQTMIKLGQQDERIVAITAAMASGTGVDRFAKVFPKRVFDVGIAEEHAVTMAAALALQGIKPVVAIYSTFLQRALDQLIHDVALQKAPVVLAIDRGGLVGDDGPTHHGVFDLSYLSMIPDMVVMAPKDENELQHMLHSAFAYNCPVAIRYPRGTGLGVALDEQYELLPLGQGEVLQTGTEVLLLAVGAMVKTASDVAQILAKEHQITATVCNVRFIKPLDEAMIREHMAGKKLLVTLEENTISGGFGSQVCQLLQRIDIQMPVEVIGLPDDFVAQGKVSELFAELGLTSEAIVERIMAKELLS